MPHGRGLSHALPVPGASARHLAALKVSTTREMCFLPWRRPARPAPGSHFSSSLQPLRYRGGPRAPVSWQVECHFPHGRPPGRRSSRRGETCSAPDARRPGLGLTSSGRSGRSCPPCPLFCLSSKGGGRRAKGPVPGTEMAGDGLLPPACSCYKGPAGADFPLGRRGTAASSRRCSLSGLSAGWSGHVGGGTRRQTPVVLPGNVLPALDASRLRSPESNEQNIRGGPSCPRLVFVVANSILEHQGWGLRPPTFPHAASAG